MGSHNAGPVVNLCVAASGGRVLRPLKEVHMLGQEQISAFKAHFRGEIIEPRDRGYNEARALYNGMIDKKPRLIARCVDAADVIAAVNFGRESGLLIAIRGGGHNGPGLASVDDGLVIDLSQMKGVRV